MTITVEIPVAQSSLTPNQKNALRIGKLTTGNITTFADLLVTPLGDIARRCKITAQDAKLIHEKLLSECEPIELINLNEFEEPLDEVFSTGDSVLDQALGGGIRTGMIWEIVGESSAGKTQVALQLSLSVQNARELGGISGSTCYLTTSSKLPTGRLKEISKTHPQFTQPSSSCSLNHVHTISIPTVPILENVLTNIVPNFILSQARSTPSTKPVKLIIIDALTELFHSAEKMSKTTLFERSKDLTKIASALHHLASTHKVAVVVINEVIDRFIRGGGHNIHHPPTKDLLYSEKSQWFSTCNSIPGENGKEASLGLVWANQLNVRIMLTKTGRRRYLDEELANEKKARLQPGGQAGSSTTVFIESGEQQATLIRRLSVIFSSVAPPISLDYIVTQQGVSVLPNDALLEQLQALTSIFEERDGEINSYHSTPIQIPDAVVSDPLTTVMRSSSPEPTTSQQDPLQSEPNEDDEDEWDRYWEEEDESSKTIDWDALELSLTQPAS